MRFATALAAALTLVAAPATAAEFLFEYRGTLRAVDSLSLSSGGPDLITTDTPFTFLARFDDQSPNLAPPIPGFRAYAPSTATIEIGGVVYTLNSFATDPDYGIGVALFDATNPIFPGFYGVGFIADPLGDGAGIVGDFGGASPDFSVTALTNTVFTGFRGAGYLAGYNCQPFLPDQSLCQPRGLDLTAGGVGYVLGFQSGDSGPAPADFASLTAVPEPSAWALMIGGLGAVGAALRRRRAALA